MRKEEKINGGGGGWGSTKNPEVLQMEQKFQY